MYRCDICDYVTAPATPLHHITALTRAVEYPLRPKVHWHPPKAGGAGKWVDDRCGHGTAIVRELRVCPSCAVAPARTPSTRGPM